MRNEKTLVLIKPDGIQRSLIGEVVSRFERIGLKLIAMKMVVVDEDFVEKHYTLDDDWRKSNGEKTIQGYKNKGLEPPSHDPLEMSSMTLEKLKKYMAHHPVIVMIWQGAHAVQIVRKLVGGTEPLTSDVGTIRGDYMLDSYAMSDTDDRAVRNVVHASGSPKEAEDEIRHWFKVNEIIDYDIVQEKILYDVNLNRIKQ